MKRKETETQTGVQKTGGNKKVHLENFVAETPSHQVRGKSRFHASGNRRGELSGRPPSEVVESFDSAMLKANTKGSR